MSHDHRDEGSVTPLVIGMMLCLMLLGAGVTAAGSAFLGGQRLQHLCDGAAAAAAGTISDEPPSDAQIGGAINAYLADRRASAATSYRLQDTTLTVTCVADTPIVFGSLFGAATLHRTVQAAAEARRFTG